MISVGILHEFNNGVNKQKYLILYTTQAELTIFVIPPVSKLYVHIYFSP